MVNIIAIVTFHIDRRRHDVRSEDVMSNTSIFEQQDKEYIANTYGGLMYV